VRKPDKERARLFSALWEATLNPMWVCRVLPGDDYEFTEVSNACTLLLPSLRPGQLMSELVARSPKDPATALTPALRQCAATGKTTEALLNVDGKAGRKTLKIEMIPIPEAAPAPAKASAPTAARGSARESIATSHHCIMGIGCDLDIAYAELLKQNDELRKAGERYLDLALTDPLTGLANRRSFQDVADREFDRARRYGRQLTLILLDMDNLKRVNDEQGHQAGDAALKAIAAALTSASRATDTVARIGGDEFAIILPETSCPDGIIIASRARLATEKGYRTLDGIQSNLSLSAGASGIIETDATFDTVFIRADRALYRAKNTGKNRTEADCPDLHDRIKGSTLN
jgi:diguanylate cyclase (GGDEF)-like protein